MADVWVYWTVPINARVAAFPVPLIMRAVSVDGWCISPLATPLLPISTPALGAMNFNVEQFYYTVNKKGKG